MRGKVNGPVMRNSPAPFQHQVHQCSAHWASSRPLTRWTTTSPNSKRMPHAQDWRRRTLRTVTNNFLRERRWARASSLVTASPAGMYVHHNCPKGGDGVSKNDSPADHQYLHDDLMTEYYRIADTVTSFDQRLLTIKSWGVAFALATPTLGLQQNHYGLFLVAAASGLAFWLIEASTKVHQMRYYPRMGDIEAIAFELYGQDAASGRVSAPLINWSWHAALPKGGEYPRADATPTMSRTPVRDDALRQRWRPIFFPYVALPHAITVLLGAALFAYGLTGSLGSDLNRPTRIPETLHQNWTRGSRRKGLLTCTAGVTGLLTPERRPMTHLHRLAVSASCPVVGVEVMSGWAVEVGHVGVQGRVGTVYGGEVPFGVEERTSGVDEGCAAVACEEVDRFADGGLGPVGSEEAGSGPLLDRYSRVVGYEGSHDVQDLRPVRERGQGPALGECRPGLDAAQVKDEVVLESVDVAGSDDVWAVRQGRGGRRYDEDGGEDCGEWGDAVHGGPPDLGVLRSR